MYQALHVESWVISNLWVNSDDRHAKWAMSKNVGYPIVGFN